MLFYENVGSIYELTRKNATEWALRHKGDSTMPDFILSSFLTRFIDEEGLKSIQRFVQPLEMSTGDIIRRVQRPGRSSSCRMALSTFYLNQWERR